MRTLEIVVLCSLLWAIYLLFRQDKKWFLYVLFGGLVVCMFHFILESYRWQMVPAYLLFLIIFLVYKRNFRLPLWFKSILSLWILSLISLPFLVPVFSLPTPTGPHTIGTRIYQWTDSTRMEWFTDENLDDYRKIMAQVWYPSQEPKSEIPIPYIDHIDIRAETIGKAGGFPGWLAGHISLVKTHSYLNSSPFKTKVPFPLLILSHGITGMRQIHTSLIESLTSYGYVVAAVDHAYDCNLTVFKDGTIADYRSDITGHPDSVNIRKMQLNTRVNDIRFVLDMLTKLSVDSVFDGLMDLNRVGVLGHSYGGTTAIQTSFEDDRFKSCLVLDSWMNPIPDTILKSGIQQPFLYLGRPHWGDSDYPSSPKIVKSFVALNPKNNYHFILKDSRHLDFCDAPLFTPLSRWVIETGDIPAKKAVSITNELTVSFFDRFLKRNSVGFPERFLNEPYLINR
jgi:hypothetical protein